MCHMKCHMNVPRDVPHEVPRDVPHEVQRDVPRDVPHAARALLGMTANDEVRDGKPFPGRFTPDRPSISQAVARLGRR